MRRFKILSASLVLLVSLLILSFSPVFASFNKNNLMADSVFDSKNSMSAGSIDSFLNSFSSSCIRSNLGFRSIDPTGYSPSGGYTYGGYTTAGTVIYHAAQAYDLNPRVLLATLQKEQSLVTGTAGCSILRYVGAMGYGCPDGGSTYNYSGISLFKINSTVYSSVSGTCVNSSSKVGFSQQVIHAAWLLKFGQQRSKGNINWAIVRGSWDNSDDPQSCYSGPMTQGTYQVCPSGPTTYYDGYSTIDGQSVHMNTGATAALYWYTPHFAGNQNFVSIYEGWFGSSQISAAYAWELVSQEAYSDSGRTVKYYPKISANPGQKIYLRIKARNIGSSTWTNSFIRVGTSRPIDRHSTFQDASWLNYARPAALTESSVGPGEIGTFDFVLTAPAKTGTYREYFSLVAEHITWMNDIGLYYPIDVVAPTSATNSSYSLGSNEVLNPGQYILSPGRHSVLVYQSDGNLVLYDNFRAVWHTGTNGTSRGKLTMQSDGNLVLRDSTNAAIWNSGTAGNTGAHLELKTNGSYTIYSTTNTELWNSGAKNNPDNLSEVDYTIRSAVLYPGQQLETATRNFRVKLQDDGNFVLRNAQGKALWSSGTYGRPGAYLVMQSDGNLVIRDAAGRAVWYTGTSRNPLAYLTVQEDGNLVLYNSSRRAIWNTHTAGSK